MFDQICRQIYFGKPGEGQDVVAGSLDRHSCFAAACGAGDDHRGRCRAAHASQRHASQHRERAAPFAESDLGPLTAMLQR